MRVNWKKCGAGAAVLLVVLALMDVFFPLNLPGQNGQQHFARIVVDETGRPLRAFADHNGVWRYQVELEDVSPLYIEALLNYEDRWFWSHPGINPMALLRAAYLNISNGRIVSGGSTLTMQVARLLHPHKRTLTGKFKQVLRTAQLEWHLSKKEILTLYLNIAPFGGTLEGVQAASFTYLNKPSSELSHAEAALLAVLPQAPTRYRPDINQHAAQAARDKVLDRLVELDVWSKTVAEDAKIEQVYAYRAKQLQLAPLLSQRLLQKNKGKGVIQTTIDGELQSALEDHLRSYIQRMPDKTSAGILVVDNQTGAVKAYLGSADFADNQRFGHVDMVKATRSPGSTLKPFLYALALEDGLIHSHSLLADVPRSWGQYRPSNFNNGFSGPVTASSALQRSLNVPFIDLLERYGAARFVDKLEAAGLKLNVPGDKVNLAVILGGAGASLEQLVAAYSALARGGKSVELKYLTEQLGKATVERHFFNPQSAWVTWKTLSDISRPGSLNTFSSIKSNQPLAWKTGTSFGFRDTWAIGVSQKYTIGVWVGRPDGTPIPGHSGRQTAGPLLFSVSDHIQPQVNPIQMPDRVTQQEICWPLGSAPDDNPAHCHNKYKAWTINDTVPLTWHGADASNWQTNPLPYWVNSESGLQVNANCSASKRQQKTAALWPKVLEPWLPRQLRKSAQLPGLDPSCKKPVNPADKALQITGIEPQSIYRTASNSTVMPSISLRAIGGTGGLHWYINGQLKYSAGAEQVIPHPLKVLGKQQVLVMDDVGNIDKVTVFVQGGS